MQALAAHGPPRKRRKKTWLALLVALAVVVGGGGAAVALRGGGTPAAGGGGTPAAGHGGSHAVTAAPFTVVSTSPAQGATAVASNATLSVRFSAPLGSGGALPTLDPPIAGSWRRSGRATLTFDASAPLVPGTTEKLQIPVMSDAAGRRTAAAKSVSFTVATGSTHRLQQLLAQLGYLPLSYTPPTPAPAANDMAEPQPGNLTWKWAMPASLTTLWFTGTANVITKGAVMAFESQNGLTVDGLPGPQVWSTLLADVASGKVDPTPYTYVYVSKTLPENLTLFDNGVPQLTGILVNTGAPGATTADGTFPVFEHVRASDMSGTNVTGSTYNDPTVPWASYFNQGDALHGFIRAQYGFPQSNGCVEMSYADAASVWPLTPIGTLVTVAGGPPAT